MTTLRGDTTAKVSSLAVGAASVGVAADVTPAAAPSAAGEAAVLVRDAYEIASRAGISVPPTAGPLAAQRRALLLAMNDAIEDPERRIDATAFASVQDLVRQSVLHERDAARANANAVKVATVAATVTQARPVLGPREPWAGDYEGAFINDASALAAFTSQLESLTGVRIALPADLTDRLSRLGPNAPMPELVDVARALTEHLKNDPDIAARIENDPALRAFHVQTLNHLRHATFEFVREANDYPHADVLASPCPFRPTLKALLKALDFTRFVFEAPVAPPANAAPDLAAEQGFKDAEQAVINAMVADPHGRYSEMRDRLAAEGPNARFPEHEGTVGYLIAKLGSDPDVLKMAESSPFVASFRTAALADLQRMQNAGLPHRATVDAIERAIECFDIVQRGLHPEISPQLYHSERYEYYIHYLSAESPEHINIPTIASLGSTDLLKTRGVPIGFWGVVTGIERVDGFNQTPYEFLIHDVNHDRRMYQFAREEAARQGITVEEFYARCSTFVRGRLLPLFVPQKGDDDETRKHKRLVKMILFEVLHEDALPADPTVIGKAMLRPPRERTPFERIEEDKRVVYFTEEGATTLAYVFRKLAHTFYDVPDDRKAYIVTQDLRTRESIIAAARTLLDAFGLDVPDATLRHYVATDEGLPDAFRAEVDEDIYRLAARFASGITGGATEADKLAAAENLAGLALMSGPYMGDEERATIAALQRDAEGKLTAPLRQILRARLFELAESRDVVSAKAAKSDRALTERLSDIGIHTAEGGTIGSANVRVFVSDISLMPVDAVIVPQLRNAASVGGVGDAVLKRGGAAGLRAFDALAKQNGELEFGTVQLAESGSSRWPYLLNVVSVHSGKDVEMQTAFTSMVNAFKLAGDTGLRSVAVPAIATGIDGRLSNEQSARAILGALDYLASQSIRIPDVVIVLQDADAYAAFTEVLHSGSYRLNGGKLKPEPGQREFDVRRWAAGIGIQLANQEDFDGTARGSS